MLKDILSGEECARCRICCSFVEQDVWEAPTFNREGAESLNCQFENENGGYRAVYHFNNHKEILLCPGLDETKGCVLGENKPFECRIWPLRVFNINGELKIGIADICPAFSEGDHRVIELLNSGLAQIIKEEANNNPQLVKDPSDGYRIIF